MPETRIRSEIAGRVWRLEAAAGDQVEEGQTIVLIESMKMEVPVAAPSAGRLVKLLVAEGEEVAEGQEVAVLLR